MKKLVVGLLVPLLFAAGCGYHAAGKTSRLAPQVHTILVPEFVNQTRTYRLEQLLTQAVVREFIDGSNLRVIHESDGSEDAVLRGTVVNAQYAPLTYDAQTGRVSSGVVTVNMKVSLLDRQGRTLFENPNFTFHEQYEVSRDIASFFEEDTPALERMSRDFARTLVSDVLESF